MRFTRRLQIAFAAAVAIAAGAASQAGAMTFQKFTDSPKCADRPCVLASGTIDPDAGERFSAFVRKEKVPSNAIVVLDSDGGYVMASLELGAAIRKAGYSTRVRRGGKCASACVYAFLGGVQRSLGDGAKVGVHQVASGEALALGAEEGQLVMSMVATHISRMCGKLDLLIPTLRTKPRDMHWLSAGELVRYAVVTETVANA